MQMITVVGKSMHPASLQSGGYFRNCKLSLEHLGIATCLESLATSVISYGSILDPATWTAYGLSDEVLAIPACSYQRVGLESNEPRPRVLIRLKAFHVNHL